MDEIKKDTLHYARTVAKACVNPFSSGLRGSLQAPGYNKRVRLYTAPGSQSVTMAANTTSAVVIFDPEASLRAGQMTVQVIERTSANAINASTSINVGRASTDFTSAGVVSSGLTVQNTSGQDTISGFQTACVLSSVPEDLNQISSTDLLNATSDRERDAAQIVCKEDATTTVSFTEHLGEKRALLRAGRLGNIVRRTLNDNATQFTNTAGGEIRGFGRQGGDHTLEIYANAAAVLAETDFTKHLFRSADNPTDIHSLGTYAVEGSFRMSSENVAADSLRIISFIAVDAANNLLQEKVVNAVQGASSQALSDNIAYHFDLQSTTLPIANVIISVRQGNLQAKAMECTITSIEEVADIPDRAVQVCVIEGINAGATITCNAGAVLSGVPDSENALISGLSSQEFVYDMNLVKLFINELAYNFQHAFTGRGYDMTEKQTEELTSRPEMEMALFAMSFGKIGRAFKQVAKAAPKARKAISQGVSKALPIVDVAAPLLISTGNPAAMGLGAGMMTASMAAKDMKKLGVLEASYHE
uniref:Capsid n=1 Tax=viral metagenome TaxID=1070528 RepID=A0A2V0RC10_9ZZZZ